MSGINRRGGRNARGGQQGRGGGGGGRQFGGGEYGGDGRQFGGGYGEDGRQFGGGYGGGGRQFGGGYGGDGQQFGGGGNARHDGHRGGRHDEYNRDGGGMHAGGIGYGGRGDGRGRDGGRGRGGGHGRGGGRGNDRGAGFLSEEELQSMSQGSSDDLQATVIENDTKFMNTFKRKHHCNHPLHLKRMIKLLYLLVKCEDEKMASLILAEILSAGGDYALFTTKIDQLLKGMGLEQRGHIRRDNLRCIEQLVDIGLVTIKTIPSTILLTFPVLLLEKTITELEEQKEKVDLIRMKFDDLNTYYHLAKQQAMQEAIRKTKPQSGLPDSVAEPPEPFTELSILPQLNEIRIDSKDTFLRSNKVKGGYMSWEHYFDVQFRLLREDFVRPLRDGIRVYCKTGSTKKTTDIRLYENAKVLNPVCLFTGIGFQVRFDSSKLRNVNWEHSRRLIFGSLLCLSNDDFEECMLFATVVKRDAKLLQDGLLTVKFEDGYNAFQIDPKDSYKMVESTAYFEAYRHILEGLQEMSKLPDVIPNKKYIVDCKLSDVKAPGFLSVPGKIAKFNMKDVLGHKRALNFDIMDPTYWPNVKNTNLDESQLKALKMALTKEISVIQGPPGTGKTFIGHKIVEAYLKNRDIWDPQRTSPILVVCFTNHALDQFLEKIMETKVDGKVPNIIRVGGRCKSDLLASCVLIKKVQDCRSDRSLPGRTYQEFRQSRTIMNDCQTEINREMKNHDGEGKNKIIRLQNLQHVINPFLYDQIMYAIDTEAGKEMEVWLGLWFPETNEFEGDVQVQDESPQFLRVERQQPPGENVMDLSDDDSDKDLIDVDNEARVLHDERFIEGEQMELPINRRHQEPEAYVPADIPSKIKDQYGWKTVQLTKSERNKKISQIFKVDPMTPRDVDRVQDPWNLSEKQKWKLYLYWISEELKLCKMRVNAKALRYNAACDDYRSCQKEIDSFVANGADVIGMTTTGAAKYHHLLKSIRPKIAIFEEAAEILEAHVITSLASSIQQLIMIGDHKQLRPKPTCYTLDKDYNLGVSLFERLVLNEIDHVTLQIQHRMRPEVSMLIHPSIYTELEDAEEVHKYDHVRGVSKDVFFIDHTHPEEPNQHNDIKSHINKFEAEYIVELCHYLLKQGYCSNEITILTMYRGQLLELRKKMKREDFQGVRVAAVDDFQGEENEIILLSLVRSNSDGSIGFLKIENRVCVSLSRAKKGLYVIGNLSMLRESESIWPKIIYTMEKEKCVGNALPLYCAIHPNDKLGARSPQDFRKRPEGGCDKICGTRLECGHSCARICHVKDREHRFSSCTKICMKPLRCGHNCKGKCFQCKKNSGCLPCSEHVLIVMPQCGHEILITCFASENLAFVSCPLPCGKDLPCGHKCANSCSEPCSIPCKVSTEKLLPCGHKIEIPCSMDPQTAVCTVKCGAMLDCGDTCIGTCGKCEQGRLHVKCKQKCDRTLVCGHTCKFPCASVCPPCMEQCNNYCVHSKCPKKCFEPCAPCMEKCEWRCDHFKCTRPCGQPCNRPLCDKPCKRILKCGHPCIGLCGMHDAKFGEKCPNKCRICDKDEVCKIFFGTEEDEEATFLKLEDCGHIFVSSGMDEWMKIVQEQQISKEVQFKVCPSCKTPLRKSLRYANTIKQVLKDVSAIKRQQSTTSDDLPSTFRTMENEISNLGNRSYIERDIANLQKDVQPKKTLNSFRVQAIVFQLSILPSILKLNNLHEKLKPIHDTVNISGCSPSYIQEKLSVLKKYAMQEFLSTQQISDCTFELRRLTCAAKLLDLLCKIRVNKSKVSTTDLNAIVEKIKHVHLSGSKNEKMTEISEGKVNELIHGLSEKYHVDGLSKEEIKQVVAAIGLAKGHWFKCPKGHLYAIGECGGATETSKCPDCHSTIGGSNHALAHGNVHAGDIDDSQHASWSEGANMANFDPAQLAQLRL